MRNTNDYELDLMIVNHAFYDSNNNNDNNNDNKNK